MSTTMASLAPLMPWNVLLRHLEELAERVGLNIRYEEFREEDILIEGGLCRIGDRYHVILDRRREDRLNAEKLARILSGFDLSGLYLLPGLREFIEREKRD